MDFAFQDVKRFLRLRDRTIRIKPHYSEAAAFDSVGVRLTGRGDFTMVGTRATVEDTVDSIFAEVSELRGRSA